MVNDNRKGSMSSCKYVVLSMFLGIILTCFFSIQAVDAAESQARSYRPTLTSTLAESDSSSSRSECFLWNDGKDCLKDKEVRPDEIASGPEEELGNAALLKEHGVLFPTWTSSQRHAGLFVTELARLTALRSIVGYERLGSFSLILPFVGKVNLVSSFIVPNSTFQVESIVEGHSMMISIHMSEFDDFRMSFTVPRALKETNFASILGPVLSSGKNAFLNRLLSFMSLGGLNVEIEMDCSGDDLVSNGLMPLCEPRLRLSGQGTLTKKIGKIPPLGRTTFEGTCSRRLGLKIAMRVPTLQNFTLEIMPDMGSITINSEIIEVDVADTVIDEFFNKTISEWPTEAQEETNIFKSLLLRSMDAASRTRAEIIKKIKDMRQMIGGQGPLLTPTAHPIEHVMYGRIRIVGSFGISLPSFHASAHVDVSFDVGSGNLSFVASNIKHSPFIYRGVSMIMRHIAFFEEDQEYIIRGEATIFSVPLLFDGRLKRSGKSPEFELLTQQNHEIAALNLAEITAASLPPALQSFRLREFMGGIVLLPSHDSVFVRMEGEIFDTVDFLMDFTYRKEGNKRPSIFLRFEPRLRHPLPVYKFLPVLSKIQTLQGLSFTSILINPFNLTEDGKYDINIASNISLWETTMSFGGSYSTRTNSYSYFARTLPDAKPLSLISAFPVISHLPIVKDLTIEAFSLSLSRESEEASTKFDFDGTGTFRNLQVRIHFVHGGDVKKPRYLFDSKMKNGDSISIKEAFSFIQGLSLPNIRLTSLSASLLDDVNSFSIGGYISSTEHVYGKIVSNVGKDSGSVDLKIDSSSTSGIKLSDMLPFAKGLPFLNEIGLRSLTVQVHYLKSSASTGVINAKALLWGIPVNFMCSYSQEKISVSIMTDSSFSGGFKFGDEWPIFKKIPGLSEFTLNSFSLKIDRDSQDAKPSVHFNGQANMFDLSAAVTVESLPTLEKISISCSAVDARGISLADKLPWLRSFPVLKDIRFNSAEVVADIPRDESARTLFVSGTASYKSASATVSSTLSEKSRLLEVQINPSAGKFEIPLSDFISVKGVLAEILSDMKILKFSLTNRVFGESSESDAAKNVERMINADMVLFGVVFSGTFEESNRQVSVLLSMDTTMSSSKFSLSSIPNMKAITKFLGNLDIHNLEISVRKDVAKFSGFATIFGLEVRLSIERNDRGDILLSATASKPDSLISIASLVPYLKKVDIFKTLGLQDVSFSLTKNGEGTSFQVEGSSLLFNIPVKSTLKIGEGGSIEFTTSAAGTGNEVRLVDVVPSVKHVKILSGLSINEFSLKFSKGNAEESSSFSVQGELSIMGIALRAEVIMKPEGVVITGTADLSAVPKKNAFLSIINSMGPQLGIIVSSYTHSDPRLGNKEIKAGEVGIFGKISPKGPFKSVSDVVSRLTKSSDGIDGLGYAGVLSSNVANCWLSVELPGLSMKLGKGSATAGLVLHFSGEGPSFALKFKLQFDFDQDTLTFVAAVKIDIQSLYLSGSLVGRWEHPFGLRNTFVENLAVQAGINYYTGIPSALGFMGTFFVHPIQVSVAVAVSIDGRVLLSGSLNTLSFEALLGVARTLGAPLPESSSGQTPAFELHDVRLFIASRPISIGEFSFRPGLSFSAGIKILGFAGYVSVSVSKEGIELLGSMSRIKIGPLVIDRDPTVSIPSTVSKLGPKIQSLPKEVKSIEDVQEKLQSMVLSQSAEKGEACDDGQNSRNQCNIHQNLFSESSLADEYDGPVVSAALSKKAQFLFVSGRISLLGQSISVHVYISLKQVQFKFTMKLIKFIHVDCEARADILSLSNIRVFAEIRVDDLRKELLTFIENLFGIQKKEKKESLDAKAEEDAEEAAERVMEVGNELYEECIETLPENLREDETATEKCSALLNEHDLVADVLDDKLAVMHDTATASTTSEFIEYRRALSSVLVNHLVSEQYSGHTSQSFVEAKSRIFKKAKKLAQQAASAVSSAVSSVTKKVVKLTKKASDALAKAAQAARDAVLKAAAAAWEALLRGLFTIIKGLIDAVQVVRAFFDADIGKITNPGSISSGFTIRIAQKEFSWTLTLDLKNPLTVFKDLASMIWSSIRQIAKWF